MAINRSRRLLQLVRQRDTKLILHSGRWHTAYKATGRLEGEQGRILAWLRDHDDSFICKVNDGEVVYDLPVDPETNFFGDQFTFAVEEINEQRTTIQRLAGANNISAARAAFAFYVEEYPPSRRILLRQRGRVIAEAYERQLLP